jgi:hypothetical protein
MVISATAKEKAGRDISHRHKQRIPIVSFYLNELAMKGA